jgi:broad specificity phosphatase PhoE
LAVVVLLHLVRHGRPLVDSTTPPREWQLDPTGISDITALRAALPPSATEAAWFSSDEHKALATARRLTDSVVQPVPKLREAARDSFIKDQTTFADAVSRSLQHPSTAALSGWEPLDWTRQRVADTVAGIVSISPGHVVLVGHGTAWTLLIHHLIDEPLPQNLPAMTMPDLLILDLSTRTVVDRWGAWRSH